MAARSMRDPNAQPGAMRDTYRLGVGLVDPRQGDIEDGVSSTEQRSILAIAGTQLAEISLPKLLPAWIMSILFTHATIASDVGQAPVLSHNWR